MAVDANGGRQHPPLVDVDIFERQQVRFGVQLLSISAQALRFSAATRAFALTLYHRFYLRTSARKRSPIWFVSASLLLASKHDSQQRRLRDIAAVVHARLLAHEGIRPRPLYYYGAAGHIWKTAIINAELDLLRELGYRVRFETPHKLVLVFANTLRTQAKAPDWLAPTAERWRALLSVAWATANDVMLTPVCVTSRVEDVACACISRAARSAPLKLPPRWVTVFGATDAAVVEISAALDSLYNSTPFKEKFDDIAKAGILAACGVNERSLLKSEMTEQADEDAVAAAD